MALAAKGTEAFPLPQTCPTSPTITIPHSAWPRGRRREGDIGTAVCTSLTDLITEICTSRHRNNHALILRMETSSTGLYTCTTTIVPGRCMYECGGSVKSREMKFVTKLKPMKI